MYYHKIIKHGLFGRPEIIFTARQAGTPETDIRIFSSKMLMESCTLPGIKVLKPKALRYYLSLTRRYRTGMYKNEEIFL